MYNPRKSSSSRLLAQTLDSTVLPKNVRINQWVKLPLLLIHMDVMYAGFAGVKKPVTPLTYIRVGKASAPAYSHGCDVCRFCRSKNLLRPLPTSV